MRVHLLDRDGVYLLAGDEVVVSKAGKTTHGLGRFYLGLAQRPIPAVSFLALSLVDVTQRRSYPLRVEQRLPVKAAEKIASAPNRGRGRPQGSKNHVKAPPVLSPELTLLATLLHATLCLILPLPVRHVVLDGFFGSYPATWLVRNTGLHLISKLRHNAALFLPYTGAKPRRGSTPCYRDKLDYQHLPATALVHTATDGEIVTATYHFTALHKDFPDPLNIVVLVKTHQRTGKHAHAVLFSTDLTLSAAQLSDY